MINTLILLIALSLPPNQCLQPVSTYTNNSLMSVYDPALGGINCDDDCSTVAMGKFHPDMYGVAGACPMSLYGATVYIEFPFAPFSPGQEFHCVDTGPDVNMRYFPWSSDCGPVFDVLWPLTEEQAPYWSWWRLDWHVVEWGGAWEWYQAEIMPQLEE